MPLVQRKFSKMPETIVIEGSQQDSHLWLEFRRYRELLWARGLRTYPFASSNPVGALWPSFLP
jgi:hypothetical protein